ncbi:MAG: response regulator [Pirellulales bacterium]|nr:response regulator [Pirellulales bacterium]
MPVAARVLVVEDEPEIRRFLRAALGSQGFVLIEAETGQAAIREAASQQPDVVILDLGLPDVEGLEVLRQIRGWSQVPVLILSARGQENDKVVALDAGADDYLTKPFGVGELLARLRVALRHSAGRPDGEAVFTVGSLTVDQAARRVLVDNRQVRLTPNEYRLLTTLVKHAGKVVTHRHLLREVWGPASTGETHYLRVYMAQLRQKLEANPAHPRYLLTEPGVGYRLAVE